MEAKIESKIFVYDSVSDSVKESPQWQLMGARSPRWMNPPDTLSAIIVRCRNFNNNDTEFESLIRISQPDVVFGTECWMEEPALDGEVFPSGNTACRNDRDMHPGGVLIVVPEGLPTVPIQSADNN